MMKVFPVKSMPFKWQCYECAPDSGYRFSVIAGTIFENTNKPLRDWFRVVHLMLTSKKGISALQIQRMMGFGSYETAHSMCHKIRAALIEPETKLGGIVEVDETYVGGKDKNRIGTSAVAVAAAVRQDRRSSARSAQGQRHRSRDRQRRHARTLDASFAKPCPNKVSLLAPTNSPATDAWPDVPARNRQPRAQSNTLSARFTRTRLKASGRSSSAASSAASTRSATNICRCTLRNFSSATTTATTPTSSERR